MPPAYRERTYRSQDDLPLYYRDYGDPLSPRTPLLCLAGLTRNSHDFDRPATRFAASRRIICPDYRGRGRSVYDSDWRNYRPEVYLGDIRHLLAAANLHRVIVIGTSLGGLLAMALGAVQPAALAGVVLNDVGPELDMRGIGRIIAYIGTDRPQPDWPSAIAHLKTMFPHQGLNSDEDWRHTAEGTFREGKDGMLHFDWDVALAKPLLDSRAPLPDMWPLFRSLRRIPVLVVRGAVSDVLSEATLARMAQVMPGLAHVTIAGVGHAPSLDEAASRAALERFLAPL